jgi:hypothetical protein
MLFLAKIYKSEKENKIGKIVYFATFVKNGKNVIKLYFLIGGNCAFFANLL